MFRVSARGGFQLDDQSGVIYFKVLYYLFSQHEICDLFHFYSEHEQQALGSVAFILQRGNASKCVFSWILELEW